ncbi:MAG: helix-turn-helix domain-containing protein [Rhodobacteraceae bacterium]|nr:helix-turn-helix domain-containing protein [Paracoccaceae bacterium]
MGDPDDKRRRPPIDGRAGRDAGSDDAAGPGRPPRQASFPAEAQAAMSVPAAFRNELPKLGRPARGRSNFGAELDRMLNFRGIRASRLAEVLGVSPSYLSALVTGLKPVSADRVEEIADLIGAEPTERARLHRAAARDMGFRLDLPEDF